MNIDMVTIDMGDELEPWVGRPISEPDSDGFVACVTLDGFEFSGKPAADPLYKTGQVRRYHANPRMAILGQSTSDHSWGVAAIIAKLHPMPSRELILAALFHDCGELFAGDLPYPFKIANPEIAREHEKTEFQLAADNGVPVIRLTIKEQLWLKLGDRLESMLFATLYRPEVFKTKGWREQTEMVFQSARDLECLPGVLALLEGARQ